VYEGSASVMQKPCLLIDSNVTLLWVQSHSPALLAEDDRLEELNTMTQK
jgi:hypothetical protein